MATQLQLRRGTTVQHATFTGAAGEISVDTTKKTVVVHDGATLGGTPLARQDGSGATGIWPVSISGNAATATNATSAASAVTLSSGVGNWSSSGSIASAVGLLAWKNYGNGHVIFDASNGTAPSGAAIGSTNAAIPWGVSYPTLMGWNGVNTYGVRVDSARVADSVTTDSQHFGVGQTWQNVTGSRAAGTTYTNTTTRPIAVSVSDTIGTTSGLTATVGGISVANPMASVGGGSNRTSVYFDVPPGSTYSVTAANGIGIWAELR